ncbi:hypothetical protein ACO1O0_007856 [Amphichorda felina]
MARFDRWKGLQDCLKLRKYEDAIGKNRDELIQPDERRVSYVLSGQAPGEFLKGSENGLCRESL